jgi:hypothetical protein
VFLIKLNLENLREGGTRILIFRKNINNECLLFFNYNFFNQGAYAIFNPKLVKCKLNKLKWNKDQWFQSLLISLSENYLTIKLNSKFK